MFDDHQKLLKETMVRGVLEQPSEIAWCKFSPPESVKFNLGNVVPNAMQKEKKEQGRHAGGSHIDSRRKVKKDEPGRKLVALGTTTSVRTTERQICTILWGLKGTAEGEK